MVYNHESKNVLDLVAEFIFNKYPNELTTSAIVTDLKQFSSWLRANLDLDLFTIDAAWSRLLKLVHLKS